MQARDWDERWRERLADTRHAEARGEPNRFLVAEAGGLAPGRALDLACGAGRNAVWLAERGWTVTGVDFSGVALAAARRLAGERGVEVEWLERDVGTWAPQEEAFELVAVLYLQLPEAERRPVHVLAARAVAPGGVLLVVAHHRDNLTEGYGGPKRLEVLSTEEAVAADLAGTGVTVERAERVTRPVVDEEDERHEAIDLLVLATRPAR